MNDMDIIYYGFQPVYEAETDFDKLNNINITDMGEWLTSDAGKTFIQNLGNTVSLESSETQQNPSEVLLSDTSISPGAKKAAETVFSAAVQANNKQ